MQCAILHFYSGIVGFCRLYAQKTGRLANVLSFYIIVFKYRIRDYNSGRRSQRLTMIPSHTTPENSEIEQRFRHAGVVLPADRAAGAYANGQRLLASLHWLRQPRTVAAEPSNTFSLVAGAVP